MVRIRVAAPCKINLHLSVRERRADGYHDLESVFQALDFGDSLGFEVLEEKGRCDILADTFSGAGFQLPQEENIVFKAVSVFRRRTGFDQGLRVFLEKRIPAGGGLGGGSSDAAAALAALDMLAGTSLSLGELRDMALSLGSDVPFFLAAPSPGESSSGESWVSRAGSGGAAWVSGRGERILPLESPSWPVLLVNPGFSSPTGEAFRRLDLWRKDRGGRGFDGTLSPGELTGALSGDPASWPYWNDFLPALCDGTGESLVYRRILSALRSGGADFAGLSGAGSTCFGVFKDRGGAERAAKLFLNEGFLIYVTFFLARSPFRVLKW